MRAFDISLRAKGVFVLVDSTRQTLPKPPRPITHLKLKLCFVTAITNKHGLAKSLEWLESARQKTPTREFRVNCLPQVPPSSALETNLCARRITAGGKWEWLNCEGTAWSCWITRFKFTWVDWFKNKLTLEALLFRFCLKITITHIIILY